MRVACRDCLQALTQPQPQPQPARPTAVITVVEARMHTAATRTRMMLVMVMMAMMVMVVMMVMVMVVMMVMNTRGASERRAMKLELESGVTRLKMNGPGSTSLVTLPLTATLRASTCTALALTTRCRGQTWAAAMTKLDVVVVL